MRHLRSLFALACLLATTMLGVVSAALVHAMPRHALNHLHLMPRAPRSIVEARRMGLA